MEHVTFENLFTYGPPQYQTVLHVLTLGYAAMLGGFVYFLTTAGSTAPRYRLSSYLSAVVMASAFFELYRQADVWAEAFTLDLDTFTYGLSASTEIAFSNGYRYMNWSIDVPVLLTQLLIVMKVTGGAFRSRVVQFVVSGLLMIYTGYVGQYYQAAAGSGPSMAFYIWGAVSTVFFLHLLYLVYRSTYGELSNLPPEVHGMTKGVFWLLFASWMLYPGAYLMPAMWFSADGVVARQITYVLADITSKVIYGVLLGLIAQKMSALEGFESAQQQYPSLQPADFRATGAQEGRRTGEPSGTRQR